MGAVEGIRPVGDGYFETPVKGQVVRMNASQRDNLIGQATRAMQHSLRRVRDKAEDASDAFEFQRQVNEGSRVSRVVSFAVTSFAGVRGLPTQGLSAAWNAAQFVRAAEVALGTGRFVSAARSLSDAEVQAAKAARLYHEYHEGIISTAETAVAVLEHTRDASFVTLGVLAIIATGGAAAAPMTSAFGLEVGTATAATAISVGAPIVATTGAALTRVALGEKVDWRSVGVEVAASLVLAKFGGKLSQRFFLRLAGNPAVASMGKIAFGRAVSALLTHEYATAFSTVVEQTYRELRYKNVTWEQFTDKLIERLTDPKGYIVAGLFGAVQAGAEAKFAGTRPQPAARKVAETRTPSAKAEEAKPSEGAAASKASANVEETEASAKAAASKASAKMEETKPSEGAAASKASAKVEETEASAKAAASKASAKVEETEASAKAAASKASATLGGEVPKPGPDLFQKTAQVSGGQAEKAKYFEKNVEILRRTTGWSAERSGSANDGSLVYHGEAQAKALVITRDGRVFTGTWGKHVKLQVGASGPELVCDWTGEGWKQW
jgi:hypothetical protein